MTRQLNLRQASGLPQRIHTVEHPKLDLRLIARLNHIDLRQRQTIRPNPATWRTSSQGQCPKPQYDLTS